MTKRFKSKLGYKNFQETGFTEDFIKNLKYVGKTFLISGSFFLGSGLVAAVISDNQTFLQYLNIYEAPILILGGFMLGGIFGFYFLSKNILIRIVGVMMLSLFWLQMFLSINLGKIFPIIGFLGWAGLAIYVYVVLGVGKFLFGELRKSGHWQRKNWP